MGSELLNLWFSFLAGLFAPLGAVCVIPLYPGFLAYLAGQLKDDSKRGVVTLGWTVTAGVIFSMLLVGLIFTAILQVSLTNVIGIISPIAFGVLGLFSLLLIFNIPIGKLFPQVSAPLSKNPFISSFLFGFFFGLIVLPCNPASLVVLFALSTSTVSFFANLLNFVAFGIGMAFPLLVLAYASKASGTAITGFLTKYSRAINLIAGLLMLAVSLYYLVFVFGVLAFLKMNVFSLFLS